MYGRTGVLAAMILIGTAPAAAASESGCLDGPVSQFGRYIGDWKIEDEEFRQDGSGWDAGAGARWIFECVGDGVAVQDFWMPNDGGFGTNLRTYNPDTGGWEIAWAARALNGLMQLEAEQQDDGRIVLDILSPKPPQPRRIVFFVPDDDGWDWVMEWSFDEGETWTPVYRIRATRWVDD